MLSNNDYLPLLYGHVYKTSNIITYQYLSVQPMYFELNFIRLNCFYTSLFGILLQNYNCLYLKSQNFTIFTVDMNFIQVGINSYYCLCKTIDKAMMVLT